MKGFAVVFMVVLIALKLAMAGGDQGVVSCDDVQTALSPCFEYLTGGVNGPSGQCCSNAWSLIGNAQSDKDREAVCNCIKLAAASLGVKPDAAKNLSGKCGVPVGYSISPNVDCSKYVTLILPYISTELLI